MSGNLDGAKVINSLHNQFKGLVNVEALGGTKTLAVTAPMIQSLDPGAARTVLLPAEASSKGLVFLIKNTANAAELITVKEDSNTTTIALLNQGELGLFVCDGATWYGGALGGTGLISTDDIADAAVTVAKMAANSVDSDQYVDGSIDLIHMSANSVDSDQYVDGSIDLIHMSANSVDSDQYVDGSIDLIHMSVNSVDSDQYVDGSIDTAHIAVDQVTPALLGAPHLNVVSKVCAFGSFTDGGGTSGYIDFDASAIPAGAVVLGWKAVVATGFTGDTTAIVQVGVSGDVDRFSADTAQSVLSAATVGANALAADAADGINAAVTPRVTVTGGADFTSISAGSMTVSIYFIETT